MTINVTQDIYPYPEGGGTVDPNTVITGVDVDASLAANLPTLAKGAYHRVIVAGAFENSALIEPQNFAFEIGDFIKANEAGDKWNPVAGNADVDDSAYGAGWNGDIANSPSRNAVYDKLETLNSTIPLVRDLAGDGLIEYEDQLKVSLDGDELLVQPFFQGETNYDGIDDWYTIASNLIRPSGELTLAFEINFDSIGSSNTIWSNRNAVANKGGLVVYTNLDNSITAVVTDGTSNMSATSPGGTISVAGGWHTVVVNIKNTTVELWINAVLYATGSGLTSGLGPSDKVTHVGTDWSDTSRRINAQMRNLTVKSGSSGGVGSWVATDPSSLLGSSEVFFSYNGNGENRNALTYVDFGTPAVIQTMEEEIGLKDNSIVNAKLTDIATQTIKGRVTAGTGPVEDLTTVQVRTIINVEDGATADQTAPEIKSLYESLGDTNAFTDAEQTKLGTVTSGAEPNAALASQAEAQTGTENTKTMTALRAKEAIDYNDWQVLDLALSGSNVDITSATGYNAAFKKIIIRLTGTIAQNTTITMPPVTSTIRYIEVKDADGNGLSAPDYTLTIIPNGADTIDETSGLTNAFELDADYQSQVFRSSFSNTKWEA